MVSTWGVSEWRSVHPIVLFKRRFPGAQTRTFRTDDTNESSKTSGRRGEVKRVTRREGDAWHPPAFVDDRRRDPGRRKGPTTLFPGSPMGCNGQMTFTAPVRASGRGSEPRSAPGFPTIAFEGVTKRYRGGGGVTDVTLEVPSGEVFGFLGPNGAGKTTTIRLLLDLIRPDAGRISLFGLDAQQDSVAIRRRVGYLPGDLALYESLTTRELLTHFCYLRGGPSWATVASLAERFELELDRPIRSLSKGNRQKVGIVQALMGEPELLILDEPTSGLDPLVQQQVHQAIREAAADGRTVFLSSHVLSEVGRIADRVGLIRQGRVMAVKRVDELRGRPVHLVDVRVADAAAVSALSGVPGVGRLETSGNEMHFEVTGSLDPLIGELARHRLADLSIREPDLEELFLSFYEAADDQA